MVKSHKEMDKKNHMKNYAKAIFSERNALTDVTIGFTWANAPLEALARGHIQRALWSSLQECMQNQQRREG